MTHPAYNNSPERINEVHRLLGRYEEKFELLRAIMESRSNTKIQSLYFNELDMKLIFQILNIPSKPPAVPELPATLGEPEERPPSW